MYIDEPNGEPYLNTIKKFELQPNLIIVEPAFELEPCDIALLHHECSHMVCDCPCMG